jgi:hypothetical protein
MENTLDVDNEHFFSDHLIRRKPIVGEETRKTIVDPLGLIKLREKMHTIHLVQSPT